VEKEMISVFSMMLPNDIASGHYLESFIYLRRWFSHSIM